MKKIVFMSFALLVLSISTAKAQSFLDKIDRAVSKLDDASNTADKASKTGGKLSSLFGKKNKQNTAKVAEDNKITIVKISNIDLANLKKLNEIISTCKGVSDTSMKYNSSLSTITVTHSGSSEKLLESVQPNAKNIFTDKNIESFDDGIIEIKMK
ncbi:hypothetical protein [Chryseobacterium paludis]|uniref:hypothetical protein n=1 Tax=Chryseobacterium paludis TaxID=2956784 RepID=UPI0021C043E0|nr:hypothetical protein [Chryseobacterium paludis]